MFNFLNIVCLGSIIGVALNIGKGAFLPLEIA